MVPNGSDDSRPVQVSGHEHEAGELGIDRETVEPGEMRPAVRGRSSEGQDGIAVRGADGELDQRCPRVRRSRSLLPYGEASLPGDEVGVHRIDPLVGHRLEQARQGSGTNWRTLARRDLTGIGQGEGIEGARGELARQNGETPSHFDVRSQAWRGLGRDSRGVHRIRRGDPGERHDDLLGHLHADATLGLRRRCAEVGRQDEVRGIAQRVVQAHRLGGVDVHRSTA